MIFVKFLPFPLFILLLAACGRPPSGGGGPPPGEFPVNVVGAPVTVDRVVESVRLTGTFTATEQVLVQSRVTGEVTEIHVERGEKVKRGALLLLLDSARIEAQLQENQARLDLAKTTFARNQRLRESDSATDQEVDESRAQVDQLRAQRALLEDQMRDTRLLAPFEGRVGDREVSVGQVVQPGQLLFDMVKTDPIHIRFEVPERFTGALRDGGSVRVESDVFPGEDFEGKLVFLAPSVRESTRTLPVRAELPNPDDLLRPGMFARVFLVMEERPEAMLVPEGAVVQRGNGTSVIVRNDEGRAETVSVVTGVRQNGMIEIREGLEPGQSVVVEGHMMIRPGSLLNFTERSRRFGLEPDPPPQREPATES